jgi:4-amino-4-deoxy-L-arabinose transferase-like glycosyltransferase
MNDLERARARARWGVWLMLAAAWFATLGWRPLFEPDEGRYAEIPREMQASGDWLTPRLDGFKYFEKPVLQYWVTAAVYSVFGEREWTSRLWSCALAFLCVPLTFQFARRLYRSGAVAAAAAAALAVNPYFAVVGQLNLLDSGLCFFLTGSVFAFLTAEEAAPGSREERRWMMLAALSMALAVLSKGPVALALAGVTVVLHAFLTGSMRPLRRWHLRFTIPLFLLVCAPWFLAVSLKNPEFPAFFFIHEHVARYLTDVHERVEPWWFFVPCVLIATLPWMGSVARLGRALIRSPIRDPRHSTTWFLVIFCIVVFVFFSASHSKLPPYILPLMPALAVLLAPPIVERADSLARAAWIAALMVLVLGAGICVYVVREGYSLAHPMVMWAALAIALALTSASISSGNRHTWARVAAGSILSLQALMMAYVNFPPAQSAKALLAHVRPLIGPHTEIFSVNQYRQSIPPYLRRKVRLVAYEGELRFGIEHANGDDFIPSLDAFAHIWEQSPDALAFIDPDVMDALKARNIPFRLRAFDGKSVVVTRR